MKRSPIELSVRMPYSTMITDGGIRIPMVPPAATVAVARSSLYPYRRISGIATRDIVAAVATDDPQIAENAPQAQIVASPSPPRSAPSHV